MATTTKIDIPQSAEHISPYWVQQVLQKDLPGVTITDVHVKGSISQGKGIMSDIIAFDAVGTRNGASQRYSLVAKLTDFERPLKVLKQSIKDWQIKLDAHEIKFYSEAVPELLSVANTERKSEPWNEDDETHPVANPLWFIPKCYFAATDPSSMVSVRVMDNLKSQGFSIKANGQPLSREEMMLAAGALAQLHGLSHHLELRLGVRLSEKYDCIMTVSDLSAMMTVSADHYQAAVKEFAATFPDQADLVARLEKLDLQPHFSEKDPRLVLNHADCYVNNIMFKYAEDVPTDVRLVDWQTPRYQPPTYELAMLFVCNASWDVFHNHRDAILAHYHHKLQNILGTNESSALQSYTLEQLKADFKADCLRGVITRFIRLMILPADPDLLRILQEIHEWGVI
ncbi:PREDICTED: uncharacterized protein LOC109486309 [Branchiostoma belcheri]|uniref:Uncharacterized protein LOC109486309 n=1 Tax=Branchiostoma belcheri TaxID=7741 RepID=A0A6P5AUM4_BRABE|nr:PREDICTED: uncharacterized protein LOC109486309 [Branchiostoma belcheri]